MSSDEFDKNIQITLTKKRSVVAWRLCLCHQCGENPRLASVASQRSKNVVGIYDGKDHVYLTMDEIARILRTFGSEVTTGSDTGRDSSLSVPPEQLSQNGE